MVIIRDDLGDDVIAVNKDRIVRIPSGTTGICVNILDSRSSNKSERETGRGVSGVYDIDVLVNGMIVTVWDDEVELMR
jgi:hypothetical protein